MSETTSPKKKKLTKRGFIVLSSFAAVLIGIIGGTWLIPPPPDTFCDFKSRGSSSSSSNQISVLISPTNNFVDMQSLISRAEQEIQGSLGKILSPEKRELALDRELSIIVADSSPKLIVNSFIDPAAGTLPQEIETQIDATFQFLEKAAMCAGGPLAREGDEVPLSPESDLIKGLAVAADQLGHTGEKKLVVLANGIQTSGAVLMQDEDSFPKNPSRAISMAKSLMMAGELPDLSGVKVSWYGLGQVDGEYQTTLPNSWANGLKTFWETVIELSGGTVENFCEQCGSGNPHAKAIPVSKLEVDPCPLIVKLYEDDGVEFRPDSTSFVSESKARSAANTTVEKFKAKNCQSLTVTGFAAAGKSKSDYISEKNEIDKTNQTLTEARAKAFAALLRAAGFSGDIAFIGGGTCGTEWDSTGEVDRDKQRLCRRVEVSN